MIRKLTIKLWMNVIPLLLVCGVIPAVLLSKYGPAALQALQGTVPELAETESMSNIYGLSALALFFIVIDVAIVIRQLTFSVGKKVRNYMSANPSVTMQELDNDYDQAEQIGNVWIGRKWTYCYDMDDIPVDNDKIVLVYNETDRVKDKIVFYLCLGLVDGKVARASVSKNNIPKIFRMYERFPRILVGNNPEHMYLYKNDMNALLDIKYRSN